MSKVITLIIDEQGDQRFLKTDSADCFLECGETITRRASHVEPAAFWPRVLFSLLRTLFADTSRVAEWTRSWKCLWRVNTKPAGGPILTWAHVWGPVVGANEVATWYIRQNAIDAEIKFLNEFFMEKKS